MISNPLLSRGMTVGVVGLGVSGMAALQYLAAHGCRLLVSDSRPLSKLSEEEQALLAECGAQYEGENHTWQFLAEAELVFKSPGVPNDLEMLQKCREKGVRLVGELALAAPVLTCKVIAITGTNGKTTVTTLVGEFLEAAGLKVSVCGNIGRPLLDCIREEKEMDVMVVEVSSFQLEDAGDFRADVGVLLNITPDHLDRHHSLEEYVQAKARIFAKQKETDIAILSGDDTICLELASQLTSPTTLLFGHHRENEAYICESAVYLRRQGNLEKYELTGSEMNNHIGLLNSAAAILAVRSFGVTQRQIEGVLSSFHLLPHRMELVDIIDGVRYCNDSKATNTGAVISALQQANGGVVLIAGGKDKGDDFKLLKNCVRNKVKKMLLIGEAAEKIERDLGEVVEIERSDSLENAVLSASEFAESGDTVLLSPACASFDMFRSYGHRGEMFRQCVNRLRATTGETPCSLKESG